MSGIIHGLLASLNSPIYLTVSANLTNTNIAAVVSTMFNKAAVVISNVALTSNVATITTSTAHGFVTGEVVTINCSNTVFEGSYTIASTPTSTTFTYAKTNANITSAAANGYSYIKIISPVDVTVTVNSGVVVGQSITVTGTGFSRIQSRDSVAAMHTGTFPTGSTVTIINNGYIVGSGGQGGDGNDGAINGVGTRWQGGTALYATFSCTVYNNGTIGGGGGGGKGGDGGGGNSTAGGGGAGSAGGVGGFGYGSGADRYGGTGTLTTGGAGTHDTGDEGGNLGQNGNANTGHDGSDTVGLAGNYVVGNSNVTWATTGTRLGSIA